LATGSSFLSISPPLSLLIFVPLYFWVHLNGEALIGDGLLISIFFFSLSLLILLCTLPLGAHQSQGIHWRRAPPFPPIFHPFSPHLFVTLILVTYQCRGTHWRRAPHFSLFFSPSLFSFFVPLSLWVHMNSEALIGDRLLMRGGGLGSSTIFKNLMSPTPRRKWYLTTGRRAH